MFAAVAYVEHVFPGAVYAPQRWQTADGCMPWHTLFVYCAMVGPTLAMRRSHDARAAMAAMSGETAQQVLQVAQQEAVL